MPESKLSTKGQVVIPKSVRVHLKLKEGDVVDFVVLDSGEVLLKPRNRDVRTLGGILKSKVPGKKVSVEQMNEAIARSHRRA